MNWLLLWYAACLSGVLVAIHEPSPKKQPEPEQRRRIREPWIADMVVYAQTLEGFTDPLYDTEPTQPQELIDGDPEEHQ